MSTNPARLSRTGRQVWLAAAGLMALPLAPHAEDFGSGIAKAFQDGKVNVAFRYRYENVDDDNPTLRDDTADASTLRSRLTYQSGAWNDLSVLMELDDLRAIGSDSYFSTREHSPLDYPLIADPEATDLNQAYIKYTGLTNTEVILGRQKIIRGNERFVGPVGWRQNEQSFDAISVNYKFSDKLQAYYAFVDVVNRIFGPDEMTSSTTWPDGAAVTATNRANWADEYEGDTHLFDATYTFSPAAKLTGYGYFIDFNENPALSSQTIGLRLAGDVVLNEKFAVPYAVEYATQEDYGNNSTSYDSDYYLVDVGLRYQKVTTRLAYEVLEGSSNMVANEAFQTPLATGHAFQGWADKFLTTPAGGIEDTYLVIDFPVLGANVKIRYDMYEAETGSYDYGDELGIWATLPLGKNYSVALKYAAFDADSDMNNPLTALPTAARNGLQDTDKFWFILSANF